MKFPSLVSTSIILVAFSVAGCSPSQEKVDQPGQNQSSITSDAAQPDIILVMTDDQGYGDLGALGNPYIITPNLDQLYDESVRFTDFHVDPTCSPTRAALMTGQHSMRAGVWHTVMGRSMLSTTKYTLAERLQDAGYRTGIFGKWHLGDNYPYRPEDQGFDLSVIHGGGGVGQTPDYWENTQFDDTYFVNSEPKQFPGNSTDVWFDQAEKFLTEDRDKPAFVYVALNAPHTPWRAPSNYIDMYDAGELPQPMQLFYAMITHVDARVGQLRDLAETLSTDRPYVFIFMSDNGSSYRFSSDQLQGEPEIVIEDLQSNAPDGNWTINAGMRDYKASVYDGGHRVPFFVSGTDIEGGRDVDNLAAHFDILPTLLDIAGASADSSDLDGISFSDVLFDSAADMRDDRTIVVTNQRVFIPSKQRPMSVMTEKWRYVTHGEQNKYELFDILSDPGQTMDISDQHPEIVAELEAHLTTWWQPFDDMEIADTLIPVGGDAPDEVRLTSMDWMEAPTTNDVPWFPGFEYPVSAGDPPAWIEAEGNYAPLPWYIDVRTPGSYAIELNVHDRVANRPVSQSQAILTIDDERFTQDIEPGASSATFLVELDQGRSKLTGWFETPEAASNKTPAFYVYVSEQQIASE
jgi:arylsulfatase A-like enzyme